MSQQNPRDTHNEKTPDLDQNPYHPFDETQRHRAFQEGWEARRERRSRADCPYNLSRAGMALAWLDGWTAAQKQEHDTEADPWRPVVGRRSATKEKGSAP
jgi:ribosome modulation factor